MTDAAVLVIDLETSGLNFGECCILQIGACWLHEDLAEGTLNQTPNCLWSNDRYFAEVRFVEGARWDDAAEAVHGITQMQALSDDRLKLEDALVQFAVWVRSCVGDRRVVVAGINPHFDLGFLKAKLTSFVRDKSQEVESLREFRKQLGHSVLDLHTLVVSDAIKSGRSVPACGYFPTDEIYQYLGMDTEPRPHHALTGALMESIAINRLLR